MGRWDGSSRAARLPTNWNQIRGLVRKRAAGKCQCHGCDHCTRQPCQAPGRDVDHIQPGDDHRLANLQLLCRWCHDLKTRNEGAAAHTQRTTRYPTAGPPGLRGT